MANRQPFLSRFEKYTIPEPNSGCLIWVANCDRNGRPQIGFEGKAGKSASRLTYQHFIGAIPAGLNVLHRCDNQFCVNPEHLFLGTQRDNMLDMLRKGRQALRVNGRYWRGT